MTLQPVSVMARLRTEGGEEPSFATRRFELIERIDHPFELTADLVTDDLELEVRALLGARASVELDRPGVTARTFEGVVTRAEYVTTRNLELTVRVVVEPSLALLRYGRRRRIFADQTLPQVLEAVAGPVFGSHGGVWDFSRLGCETPPRDYAVQYDESDLDFVLRLLSEAGLCLLHGEGPQDGEHTYVIVGRSTMLPGYGMDPAIPAESKPWAVLFEPEAEEEMDEPSIQYLGRSDDIGAQGVTVRARNWKTSGAGCYETRIELGDDPGRVGHAWIHHPGRLDEGKGSDGPHHDETEAWARRRLDERRAAAVEVSGASNVADFFAGSTFELQGHPHPDLDQRYAMLSVVHRGDFPEAEVEHAEGGPTYTNRFVATPLDAGPVRPPLRRKPSVTGIESATVVGPEGEEIHTDALGRVRVRFHWDESSPAGTGQTCWLRVLSPWAGPGFGASFVPRVGMEVAVAFLGADPDRPVVTGCLYTGTNLPPGALPETKTQTVLRTQSSPGGEGFNELRFEDAAGSEEVFLHAQRNQRTVVRAAQSTRVGASRRLSVGKDSTRTIGGSETVRIGEKGEEPGDLEVVIAGGERRTVGEAHELTADSALWRLATTLDVDATNEVKLSCAQTGSLLSMSPKAARLEATDSIELRVGKTSLRLTPRGIELRGDLITIKANEQAWIAAPAGRLVCNRREAEVSGGAGRESVVRLREKALDCKAKTLLRQTGRSVVVTSEEQMTLEGGTTSISGATVEVKGRTIDIHADGAVDVDGAPIRLN